MKAVVIHAYGNNDVVQLADVDRPEPGPGEVRIAVRAAGVNPVDWKIRDGAGQRMGMTLPIRLGSEVAGIVDAVDAEVRDLEVGDAVFGMVPSGGFAEYAIAKAADLATKPARLDDVAAAAVPLAALTAWQAMFDVAKLEAGQKLLITSASGGVGSMAVQLAKSKGAHVTGMASGRNAAFVRSLGADAVVDYETQAFEEVVSDMDVVFDTVGGDVFRKAFRTLREGGFLVTSVAFPTDEDRARGVGVARVQCKPDGAELAAIRDLIDAGKLEPHVTTVLPLADVKQAFDLSAGGHTRGKTVLKVSG